MNERAQQQCRLFLENQGNSRLLSEVTFSTSAPSSPESEHDRSIPHIAVLTPLLHTIQPWCEPYSSLFWLNLIAVTWGWRVRSPSSESGLHLPVERGPATVVEQVRGVSQGQLTPSTAPALGVQGESGTPEG